MIRLSRRLLRKWVELLLHTHDTPQRTAAAFALGVFLGFSPLFGLHTVLGVVLAFALRLNRLAAIAGVYVNLPWFVAPYYTVTTMAAARLLGMPLPERFAGRLAELFDLSMFAGAFWTGLAELLRPLLVPFVVGSTAAATALGVAAYFLAVPAIVAGRKHLHLPHRHGHLTDTR